MTIKPRIKRGAIAAHQIVACLIVNALIINAAHAETAASAQTIQTTTSVKLQHWLNRNVDNHPSVLAAKSAVVSAEFQLIAADKALYNPELEIDAETAETDSASIGISQTIDWGDTRGARTEMAGSQRAAAQFGLESTRRDIAAKFLTGLSDYHTTSALQALAEEGNTLMQRSARLAKQRSDAGDLGKVEVDLANLSYAQARFKLADAKSQHARAIQKLIALTGDTNKSWPSLLSVYPDPKTKPQEIDKTVQQLPQMREILSKVKSSQANIKVQKGKGTAKPTFAFRAGKEEEDALIGLTFSVPLKIRNNFKAEVDSANAEMIQAERESIDAYRKLKSRLEIAIVSYDLSREAWLSWQQSGADTLSEQITYWSVYGKQVNLILPITLYN
jgi:cobalt-zinc-cadmium efflux system outer membrane protein